MKNKILILGAVLLLVLVTGCREESDAVQNYAFNDGLAFQEAQTSFAGKFKLLWKALNQNYAIWDYERSMGVDWDAVYDEFLPKYEALDERDDVTDEELQKLLEETVAPLHDGHFAAQMQNHKTGGFVLAIPSSLRDQQRDDYQVAMGFEPNLTPYYPVAYGGNGDIVEAEIGNTNPINLLASVYNTPGIGYRWAKATLANPPADWSAYQLQELQGFVNDFENMVQGINSGLMTVSTALQVYNTMVLTYKNLQIPGLNQISSAFASFSIAVKYALFKNNVAYFYLSRFALAPYLDDNAYQQPFGNADAFTKKIAQQVRDTWRAWVNKVQELHAQGKLKGVIIDVRSNGGGMLYDYQYVLGSLLASGEFEPAMSRYKRGLGRYDYSPLTPFRVKTLEEPHEAITEPIVMLTNCKSVSMSEMTSLGCRSLPNGTLIGKRTHGGLCGLNTDPGEYSKNYAGIIGEQNKTPVYLYIPQMVTMSKEEQIFEGIGLAPDIEVSYDPTRRDAQGRPLDSQLERALQFCETGH